MGEINFLQAQKDAALAINLDVGSETECQAFFFPPCSLGAWQRGKSSYLNNYSWSYFLNLVIHICILSVICIFIVVTQLSFYLEYVLSLLYKGRKQYYRDEDKGFSPAEMNCHHIQNISLLLHIFLSFTKINFKNTPCKISPNDIHKSQTPYSIRH